MALKITAVNRSSPAPCDHWDVTIVNEVTSTTRQLKGIHRSELENSERYDDVPWWVLLALLWLRARLAAGFTLASSVNVEIVG